MMLEESTEENEVITEYNIDSITDTYLTSNGYRFEAEGDTDYDSDDSCERRLLI